MARVDSGTMDNASTDPEQCPKGEGDGAELQKPHTTDGNIIVPPPSSHQQQPQPLVDPPIIHNVIDDDNDAIEPPFAPCSTINSEAFVEIIISEDQAANATQSLQSHSAELKAPPSNHPDPSLLDDVNIIDNDDAQSVSLITASPTKQLQPSATPITPETPPPESTLPTTTTNAAATSPIRSSDNSVTSSITDSISEISTVQRAYKLYNRAKQNSTCCFSSTTEGGSHLQDIIEGVQLCGMYCIAELFDEDSHEEQEDEEKKVSKGERMKELNRSFLGKMIQCGDNSHCVSSVEDDVSIIGLGDDDNEIKKVDVSSDQKIKRYLS